MDDSIISAKNVHKIYGTGSLLVNALNGIDMEVGRGEMIAIMGPSGCGKTTLLNCLSGLDSINSGNIFVDQQPIHDLSDDKMSEFRAKSMGFIFQTYNLLPVLTARENVEAVGLLEWSTHKPGELSGGQRQRVAIARALVNKPAIVWADEPTGNLDSNNENEIMELLSFTNSQYNQTIVLVTHSDKVAAKADRIVRMEDGIIVNSG